MNLRFLGRCSLCGGDVTVPVAWFGIVPPIPTCRSCGATAARPETPVVPMERRAPSDDAARLKRILQAVQGDTVTVNITADIVGEVAQVRAKFVGPGATLAALLAGKPKS